MKKVQVLPSLITTCNLICGFFSICLSASFLRLANFDKDSFAEIMNQKSVIYLYYSCGLIFAGMVFDAFDGKVARMTRHVTEFGGELDSFADAVTFGIAPAFLAVVMMHVVHHEVDVFRFDYFLPAVFMVCAVMRLARYNVERNDEKKDKNYFKGLPTPAGAAALVSFIWLQVHTSIIPDVMFSFLVLLLCLVLGVLEVSNMRYLHLGQKLLKDPKSIYMIAVYVLVIFILIKFLVVSLFFISFGYVLFNTIVDVNRLRKEKKLLSAFEDDADGMV